jgi:alkanesulfonate monooxygenase SsuD/methylene tetrahydromethanopterin reductase-like flavin-dependent oxidoreductase (luciferase family)
VNFPVRGPSPEQDGPGRPGRPRLILGVTGPKRGPMLAARFADEFNCGLAEGMAGRVANFRRICAETGRDPATVRMSTALPVSCGATATQARQRAGALGEAGARLLRLGVIGTPGEVAQRIEDLAAAGADTLYFHVYDTDPDHLRLLGSEVLPKVS